MIIVFYNANENRIYVSSLSEKTQVYDANDQNWISKVPNEDVLYVTNGHFFTRPQFEEWIQSSDTQTDETDPLGQSINRFSGFLGKTSKTINSQNTRKYIHGTKNGTAIIGDIINSEYPDGVKIVGKWHFIPVDRIGEDVLESSAHYRFLIKNKRLEVVDEEYVKQHAHKNQTKVSPTEAALNKILIKDSTPGAALKVQSQGGLGNDYDDNVAIPIYING